MGTEALLLMVAFVAHPPVLVARGLPCLTDRAAELHNRPMARPGQAAQHTSTAARERRPSCALPALVVQWSIAGLTLVEADIVAVSLAGQAEASHI